MDTHAQILIGTRGSALALAQARLVAEAFAREGRSTRLVVVETEGDRRAPDTAWGEGAFVKSIERALLSGRVDVAVHSAKDIPTDEDQRLAIAAFLPRADPRDALVVRVGSAKRSLDSLPRGARVGTDSPRRTGFILARRPDLRPHPLHGNVDTRLRRLDDGETDALILAVAGLDRLGRADRIAQPLEPELLPPAPGQGAIAVQIRKDDARMLALAASIDDPPTRVAVTAERTFLAASGGGCRAPIGALASLRGDELELLGGYASPDGRDAVVARDRAPATSAPQLARTLAARLGPQRVAATRPPLRDRPRVVVTRAPEQADALLAELRDRGLEPVLVPAIVIEPDQGDGGLLSAVGRLEGYAWVVVTSANGTRAVLQAADRVKARPEQARWAVLGAATRAPLDERGIAVAFEAPRQSGNAIAETLPVAAGESVLLVRGDLADDELPRVLRARGAIVDELIGYRTREAPASSRPLVRRALGEARAAAVIFTSSSTVRGFVALARAEGIDPTGMRAICIGASTASAAEEAGFRAPVIAARADAVALAEATARVLALTEQEEP